MLSVREIQAPDIDLIAQYWLGADPAFLRSMGADKSKLPNMEQWQQMLGTQIAQSYPEKQSYCIIWELDGRAIGHCNINKIKFGQEAYLHLHLWHPAQRQEGLGSLLVKMSLPFFFKNMELQQLYSEPYALNPAPNKALEKLGFTFVKKMTTVPGSINFEQEVNLWAMSRAFFLAME